MKLWLINYSARGFNVPDHVGVAVACDDEDYTCLVVADTWDKAIHLAGVATSPGRYHGYEIGTATMGMRSGVLVKRCLPGAQTELLEGLGRSRKRGAFPK